MFTKRKLLSLSPENRRRKLARLLEEWLDALRSGAGPDERAAALLSSLDGDELPSEAREALGRVLKRLEADPGAEDLPWELDGLRHSLLATLGAEPADWDFRVPGTRRLDASARRVFPFTVYLDGIRSPFNAGSIFRSAECFGVREILLAPGTVSPEHPRAKRSGMGSTEVIGWRYAPPEELSTRPNVFALELGGTPVDEFDFPEEGVCIVGNEELGVGPALRTLAGKSAGIVSLPLYGAKGSLNASVAFGILMFAWTTAVRKDSSRSRS